MSTRAGFTLLEVCLACAIGLMLMFLVVPSLAGVFADQKLKESSDRLEELVRKAQMLSVSEQRAFRLVLEKGSLVLEPEQIRSGDGGRDWGRWDLGETEELSLERPVALERKAPKVWTFWRSGNCEPAVVGYRGPAGSWVLSFDPLTARGTFEEQTPR